MKIVLKENKWGTVSRVMWQLGHLEFLKDKLKISVNLLEDTFDVVQF